MSKVQGVLFDCNGVIIDDYLQQRAAWDAMSLQLRGKKVSEKEMEEHILSIGTLDIVNWMTDYKLSPDEVTSLGEKKREIIAKIIATESPTRLMPGVTALFDFLTQQKIPFTMVTAGREDSIREYFNHFSLEKWLDWDKIVYHDGTHNNKPAPDPYVIGSKRIGIDPSNCLVFEDSKGGILSAFGAGCRNIIGIARSNAADELSALPGVITTIKDFTDFDYSKHFGQRKRS